MDGWMDTFQFNSDGQVASVRLSMLTMSRWCDMKVH